MKVNKVSRPKGLSANVTDNDGRHFIRLNKTKDKSGFLLSLHILWQTQYRKYENFIFI